MKSIYGAALVFAVAAGGIHAGEPEPLWINDTVESRIGELAFRECSVTYRHRTRFLECADLEVPEDYTDPDGRSLSLFIARLPARRARATQSPLLAVSGGPGQAASEAFQWLDRQFYELAGTRDIYLIDQRGTGLSRRQDCDLDSRVEMAAPFDTEAVRAASDRCLEMFDGDPRQFTTSVAINDFEAVREALAIEAWNLYGGSYGTRVVQHYMRRHPAAVRSATLDGVVPPELNLGPDIALHSQAALETLFARCSADTTCDRRFPALETNVNRLLAELEKQPVPVKYTNTRTGRPDELQFTRRHLVIVIRMMLYQSEVLSVMPLMLERAYADNDFSALASMAARVEDGMTAMLAMGMHNAVVCSEDAPYLDAVESDALSETYMGTRMTESLRAMCADWPAGVVDAGFKQPLESTIPTLLLSGEHDPITPPAYAERVLKGLPRAKHIVAPGQGHFVAASGCLPRIVSRFVETASVDNLQTDCVSRLQAAPVFINVNGPVPAVEEGTPDD